MIPAPTLHQVFLNPGDYHFGGPGTLISTLLGSCVSITLWHPRLHYGAMCHYQLAERKRPPGAALDGRFADEAFELLLAEIANTATVPADYQAKLFGGGAMFVSETSECLDIGPRNVQKGRSLLKAAGIPLVAEHVGGSGHRKLHFELDSGTVWLAFPDGRNADSRTMEETSNG